MNTGTPIRLAVAAPVALAAILLTACGSTSGGSPATSSGTSAPTSGAATASGTPSGSGSQTSSPATTTSSGGKCTDLTAAAASAAVGKSTTVTLDTGVPTPASLTICDVAVAGEIYPIQLDVDTAGGQTRYDADKQVASGVSLSGIGDEAFRSEIGVEVLSGNTYIEVTGPAGAVLSGDFTIPTALAKAMVSALQ